MCVYFVSQSMDLHRAGQDGRHTPGDQENRPAVCRLHAGGIQLSGHHTAGGHASGEW